MSQDVLYRTGAKGRLDFGSFLINMFFLFVDCILSKIIKLKYIIHKLCGWQDLNNDKENTIRINSALRFWPQNWQIFKRFSVFPILFAYYNLTYKYISSCNETDYIIKQLKPYFENIFNELSAINIFINRKYFIVRILLQKKINFIIKLKF